MESNIEKRKYDIKDTRNVVLSLLIGGLAGAGAMMLFAPQSGKRTRAQIQLKTLQLFDRTTDMGREAFARARYDTHEITTGLRDKAGQLKHLGQDQLVRQMDNLSTALDAGKAAVKAA